MFYTKAINCGCDVSCALWLDGSAVACEVVLVLVLVDMLEVTISEMCIMWLCIVSV